MRNRILDWVPDKNISHDGEIEKILPNLARPK
jgi:hypothetical protein